METKDLYWEHTQHDTYQKDCSTCFKENRYLQAHKVVNAPEKYENNLSEGWNYFINNLGNK